MNGEMSLERADLKEGFELIRQRRLEEARAFFEEALRVDPEDADALFGLGCVYATLGERDRAVESWRRCLRLNPEMGEAHYALAWAYYDAKDYDTGFRHVEMAYRSGVSLELLKELFKLFVKTGKPIAEWVEKPKERKKAKPTRDLIIHIVCSIALFILCYLLLRGTLHEGYPHDHLDATVAFYIAKIKILLSNGFKLYTPVWYFGYELLRFYPPLSTIIPYIAIRLTGNILTTYYALCLIYYALYVIGTYFFASRFLASSTAGILAAVLWSITHANFVSFQGHYWETARLMGTALVPWTLYFVDRFLAEGRKWEIVASTLAASYVLLSSMLSAIDLMLLLIPFLLIRGGLAPTEPEPDRYSTPERMGHLLILGIQGLMGFTLWWYIPAILPHGIGVFLSVGKGRSPPLFSVLFQMHPPSWMTAIQLPITLLGLVGTILALILQDRRGAMLTIWFLSTTIIAYIIGLQSVRLILNIGFSLVLLSAFTIKVLEEQIELHAKREWRGISLLIVILISSLLLYVYLPKYAAYAVVDDTYKSTDEYLTATWLADHLNESYRVYVMYGDSYRGTQWLNAFNPNVRQVLGGFDQGGRATRPEPFDFDYLVKWRLNATEVYEMAINYHIKYIIVDRYWMLINSPYAYEKFKNGKFFIQIKNDDLRYAEIYEVRNVTKINLDEGGYKYWDIWKVIGIILSAFFFMTFMYSLIKRRKLRTQMKPNTMIVKIREIKPIIKLNISSHTINLIIIAIMTFFTGATLYAWKIYPIPIGCDSISHLAKVRFVLSYFPHLRWNHLWGCGMPLFRWYPPLFYLTTAALTYLPFVDIPEAAVLMLFISYCLTAVGIYGFIWEITRDKGLSLLASAIALTTPAFWRMYTIGGLMARISSAAFYTLTLYASMKFVKNGNNKYLIISSLMISISTLFHLAFGATAIISCFFLYMIFLEDLINKFKTIIKTIIMVFLFTAWFTIPFISPMPANPLVTKAPLESFLNPFTKLPLDAQGRHPNPIVLVLTIALIIIFTMKERVVLKNKILYWSIMTSIVLFIFATQKLDPDIAMIIITFSILPTLTYLLSLIDKKKTPIFLLIGCIFFHVFTSSSDMEGLMEKFRSPLGYENRSFLENVKASLNIPEKSYHFRVGIAGEDAYASQWFNYIYDVPQTREYYGQGIPNPKLGELYTLIFQEGDEYNKSNFLLDWYGVKWILARDDLYVKDAKIPHYQKFIEMSSLILGGKVSHYYEFIYENVTPIVVVSNTISLLIIGDFNAYCDTFTAFMYSNRNSLYVIPIRGSQYIDDYTLDELLKFDAVLIRGYSWHDRAKAWGLLEEYVKKGGSLIIETGYSPDSNSRFIPLPCPVESTYATDFGLTWNITHIHNEITEGIRFDLFSPPLYGLRPWGVSATDNETVRGWAEPIVFEEGHPLVVIGRYGDGRVAWCGFNLPFHISCHRNYWESLFWFRLIAWTTGKSRFGLVKYDFDRPNPEKVIINIQEPANGVLFKENIFKNWRAYLIDVDGRKIKLNIYEAGPSFMYISIPEGVQYPIKVIFKYSLGWEYLIGFTISLLSYIGIMMYIFNFLTIHRRRNYV